MICGYGILYGLFCEIIHTNMYIYICIYVYLHIMLQLYNLPEYNMIQWYNTPPMAHHKFSNVFVFIIIFVVCFYRRLLLFFFSCVVFFSVCGKSSYVAFRYLTNFIYIFRIYTYVHGLNIQHYLTHFRRKICVFV